MTLFSCRLSNKFIVIILFYSIASSLPAFDQTNEDAGFLKIESDSIGIEVRLNNKLLGYTPLPIISLLPGNYLISAVHPHPYLWGNFDWQDTIKILSNDTLIVQPKFKTFFFIRTNPFGAEVFLNNELQGNSPLSLLIYSKNNLQQLLIKKEGYKDYFINLNEISNNFLNVSLTKNNSLQSLKEFNEQKQRKLKNRYRKLAYSFWGLSIVSGLSTAYLKDQADEKYQQYLVAGSLSDMNKYYNESKRFDRYSYVSVGILQGCFALSFYFLMKSLNES